MVTGDGLINLSTMYYMNYWFGAELSAFDWDCTGRPLAYLVAELAVFSFLVRHTYMPLSGFQATYPYSPNVSPF